MTSCLFRVISMVGAATFLTSTSYSGTVNVGQADYHTLATVSFAEGSIPYFNSIYPPSSQESFNRGSVLAAAEYDTPMTYSGFLVSTGKAFAQAEGSNQPFVKASVQNTGYFAIESALATVSYSVVAVPLVANYPAFAHLYYSASGSVTYNYTGPIQGDAVSTLSVGGTQVGGLNEDLNYVFGTASIPWSITHNSLSFGANIPIPVVITASVDVPGLYALSNFSIASEVDPLFQLAPESQPYFELEYSPNLTDVTNSPEPPTVLLVAGCLLCLVVRWRVLTGKLKWNSARQITSCG